MTGIARAMEQLETEMQRTAAYIEKIRIGQERVHTTHSACRNKDREYVTMD